MDEQTIKRLIQESVDRAIKEHAHDGILSQRVDLLDIFNYIDTVTTAPTGAPSDIYGQIKIHYNSTGPVARLYIYDFLNNQWNYVTLTIV